MSHTRHADRSLPAGPHLRSPRWIVGSAAAAILVAGFGVTACTTDGEAVADPAALTTTTTTSTTTTTTSTTTSTSETSISVVPAPANSTTMTCREFALLDPSTQVAVLRANGATANTERLQLVARVMGTLCSATPDVLIADLLRGQQPG